ncbi:uncharacterized protein [Clytia hemisphaerica]|uniref:uncharacterized protein n=1 Tax=Clytia hemisphaerica TaxID=252671 RepID=UPI0034D5E656
MEICQIRGHDCRLGTRRCTAIQDVDQHSKWINGYEWMRSNPSDFPAKTTTDISLTAQEKQHLKKESREEVHKEASTKERHLLLNDADIERAKSYYFKKATSEVKQFTNKTKYNKISEEKDGILFYTGRILPTDQITAIGKNRHHEGPNCVNLLCANYRQNSPLAYSIVQEVHWNHPTAIHSGIETTWRYVLQTCYILEGRSLVKQVRSSCPRCRYLLKRKFQVIMGPLSEDNLKIAPAFFVAQTDLAGPFQSYSEHHKRTTVKIWLLVFCCATTTAVKIKVMDSYNTTSFLQAFTRLACEVGYSKKLLVDEGKRKIQEIKKSIDKTAGNQRLSILHWRHGINNLELNQQSAISRWQLQGVRDVRSDHPEPPTPRPQQRPLTVRALTVTNDTDKILRTNKKIFDSWFECWLTSHVPALMDQPKWFKNDNDNKPGDIVLFTKQESSLSANYQFGIVKSINKGRDGKIRDVIVQYQNSTESQT